jgi:hypothetical protein
MSVESNSLDRDLELFGAVGGLSFRFQALLADVLINPDRAKISKKVCQVFSRIT